jgi:hypothetical protein
MCIVTMNMSSGEVEYADSITYSDEVLCAGWNPALEIRPYTESHNTMPPDMLSLDTDAFLTKMYANQR